MPIDSSRPVRIISDIHWGHPASLVRRPEQLRPLFEGAGTVVFNGDTLEQAPGFDGSKEARPEAAFEEVCREAGAGAFFVSGNHDPSISGHDSLALEDGRVLVTHGDVVFPEISVWGRTRHELRAACESLYEPGRAPHEAGFEGVTARVRETCRVMLDDGGADGVVWCGWVRFFWRQGWPPGRALRILRCWRETALRGVGLAGRHHATPRFVVMGHTHYPGVWHRDGVTVINTGSYFPLMGRRLVQIHEGQLTVRRVVRGKNAFYPGRLLGRWRVLGS